MLYVCPLSLVSAWWIFFGLFASWNGEPGLRPRARFFGHDLLILTSSAVMWEQRKSIRVSNHCPEMVFVVESRGRVLCVVSKYICCWIISPRAVISFIFYFYVVRTCTATLGLCVLCIFRSVVNTCFFYLFFCRHVQSVNSERTIKFLKQ